MTILKNNNLYTSTNKYNYEQYDMEAIKIFGFWIYLMSDCILFCCLFAAYAVLVNGISSGPAGKDIFKPILVLIETLLILFSSFTYSMATVAMNKNNINRIIYWLALTWIFGASFIWMEIYEFYNFISKGFGPDRSGFLSAFFALVGAHGLHVIFGLIWMIILIIQIINSKLTNNNRARILCLDLFWHFLDILWICIFSIVYLVGLLQ